MSANLPTSDHLDHSEDQKKEVFSSSVTSITESSVKISVVSVVEISSDEVMVSTGSEMSDRRVEEKLKEVVVGKLDDSVKPKVNEERETGIEVVKVESSVVITESVSVDRIGVGEGVEGMEKEEGVSEAKNESEVNGLDGNLGSVEKDGSLELETVGGSGGVPVNENISRDEGVSEATNEVSGNHGLDGNVSSGEKDGNLEAETVGGSRGVIVNEDISSMESTSLQDKKQETVALVEETVPNHVVCDERVGLDTAKENQNDGESGTVNTNSVAEVFVGSQNMENEPGIAQVTETIGTSDPNGDLNCEVNNSVEGDKQESVAQVTENVASQVDGDERMESHPVPENLGVGPSVTLDTSSIPEISDAAGVEVVKVERSTVITESLVEQIQVVEGGEVSMMDYEEVRQMAEVAPEADASGVDPPFLERNQSVEAQVVGGSSESHGNREICGEVNTSMVDEKQEMVAQVSEAILNHLDANKTLNSYTVEEKLDEGACGTVGSNFPQVTESSSHLVDGSLGSEVHSNEGHAPDEGQKAGTKIAEDGSTKSFPNGSLSLEENTSIQAEKQDTVAHVAEMIFDQVDVVETKDSCPVNENLGQEVHAKIPDGSQAVGSTESFTNGKLSVEENTSMRAEKQDMAPQEAVSVSDHVDRVEKMDSCPVNENLDEAVFTTVDSSSLSKIPDGSQDADSGVREAEGKVAEVDGEDVSKTEDISSGNDAGDQCLLAQSQNLGAEAVNGNPSAVQIPQGHAVEDEELESRTKDVNNESSAVIPEPLVERNPEVQVTEGHIFEDEKLETRIEAINPEYSLMITKPPVDDMDNVFAGEITLLENKKVFETRSVVTDTNATDGTSSDPVKNQSLEAEALGGSIESYQGVNDSCYVNSYMQDEKHEVVAQAAEIVSNTVDEDPAKEKPIEDDYVIVDSNSLPEVPNGSQASVSCAPSAESAVYLLDGNLDSEVEATETHALEDESQKSGTIKVGCSELINEALVEQNQVVGCEVAVVENEEASKTKSVSGDLLDGSSSCPEKNQSLEAKAISHPVEDPIRGPCFTGDSSSVHVVVDGSQFTGGCPDSEVQRHAAAPHEDENILTHVSEVDAPGVGNQNTEVVAATESAGRSSMVEGSQVMESHPSQVGVSEMSLNDCIIGTPEPIYPPEDSHGKVGEFPEIEGDLEFFELDCLDDVQTDDAMDDGDCGDEKVEIGEQVAGFDQAKSMEQQLENSEALKSEHTATYHLTPEREAEFSISDLVWGKVRSHPWWPGQIFNSSDASEQAMKYHKKDNNFLVAYFGDQTFAWNDASAMKPFRTHFSQMEKQNSTESFRVAVNGALDEVRRRVELGMACSCTPEEVYAKLKSQVIENPGIREEARRTDGLDKNLSGSSFRPDNLVQYIKDLALHPRGGSDRLELAIAQAQLLAFYRLKGHFRLPEFHVHRGLSKSDLDISFSREGKNSEEMAELATPFPKNEEQVASVEVKRKNPDKTSRKRKHFPDDNLCSSRKERSLSDLMAGKKPDNDGHNHPDVESPAPQSFKVGECIRRIASQLTGAPSILKSSSESHQTHEGSHRRGVTFPKEYSHPDEMLSQLCLAARDPMKGYSFLTIIIGFFSDFRDSISLDRPSLRKHKKSEQVGVGNKGTRKSNSKISSAETFDFEDTSDSYWTDRVIQNTSDEQTADKNHDRKEEPELGTAPTEKDDICVEPGKSIQLYDSKEKNLDGECDQLSKSSRKNRKRKEGFRVGTSAEDRAMEKSLHTNDHDLPMKKPRKPRKKQSECLEIPTDNDHDLLNNVDRGHEKNGPTALLLSFTEPRAIPSEANLNRTFRRFGPLKESETEVMRDTNSAKVVFKMRNDAEVALSSAGTFSIFGPVAVSYQLSSFLLPPSQASLFATPQGREDATSVEWNTI